MNTLHVSELYLYPLKGAAAIPLRSAQLDSFGLQHDRRFMAITPEGEFLTQRNCPPLALLRTAVRAETLVLQSPRAGELQLPLQPVGGEIRRVRIWDDEVDAVDVGAAAASFLAAHLETPARLLHMPDSTVRQADLQYATAGDRVSFADGFPMLLISQGALDALNAALPEALPMLRFRPNIVVAGAAPHEEDTWRRIRIGSVECDVVKPCARCVVTTIDQATAVAGAEPLRTLANYRRWNGKVWFGQNVIHRSVGTLAVGQPVEVVERGDPRPPLALPARGPAGAASGVQEAAAGAAREGRAVHPPT